MALPKLQTSEYRLTLPSTQEEIKYRPFLVKEQKLLMIAQESEDEKQIADAMATLISNCTFGVVNANTTPMFDVEYLFLNIRAKSVGEVSTVNLRCPDDNETFVQTEIDLTKVNVQITKGHTNKIELTDEMGMILQYPTLDSFTDSTTVINASNMLDVIASCVSQIYDKKGEDVYDAKDSTKQEIIDFLESLNSKQFLKIQKFFDTMPKLTHTVNIENPETKVKSDITLTGLNDFFV